MKIWGFLHTHKTAMVGNVLTGRGHNRLSSQSVSGLFVVKIEKTNSNSTRDFSKRINFTRVDPFVWSTLVVKAGIHSILKRNKENIILLPVRCKNLILKNLSFFPTPTCT